MRQEPLFPAETAEPDGHRAAEHAQARVPRPGGAPAADERPEPTAEQRRAIAARERDVFCEAGAGSGKTRVLVDRYCDAVVADGVGIEAILAFTFTDRAAAELRQRIRRELGRRARAAARAGERHRAAELRTLARETERAWVTTIHGFCRRLLGAHPIVAGLDPRFRVLDAAEAGRLRERAAREAIEALVAAGDEEVARAAASYKPARLAAIALAAHERLRSQGIDPPRLPEVGEPIRSGGGDGDGEPEPLTPAEVEVARTARAALERVLEELDDRYRNLKDGRSALDFADLELRTVELLRSSPALGAGWRERFEHLMVDEFQDTNRVQLELIGLLRGPQTRLFSVGDEHQSVYRFRNADLEVFRAQRRNAEASQAVEVMPLRGNFRSRPPVLAAANTLGGALLDGFEPLRTGREGDDVDEPRVELLLTLEEPGKESLKWEDVRSELRAPSYVTQARVVAEARSLALRLRELVDRGEARPGEIVVLLRAFTHVDAYEEALRRFGLEPYVVGGRGYWSQQQVEDLLRLLGVVANPLDDELLFGALASPACEVTPDALWLLRRAAGERRHVWPVIESAFGAGEREPDEAQREWLAEVGEEDVARLRRFCATLAPLRAEAALLPLDTLVERTMSAFDYDLALLARDGGAGRMANVRKLMRLAAELERNEGRDLRAFLAQAKDSTRRDEREGMAPVHPEDHDGVRVMTVHGAKGLEFPVVAVPDLGRKLCAGHHYEDLWIGRVGDDGAPPRFGLRLVFPSAAPVAAWELKELDRTEQEAEAEEACRLLYVAATRARERLILSGVYRTGDAEPLAEPRPSQSAIRRLLPALGDHGWDGQEGELSLPAPAPALSEATRDRAARMRVAISAPGPRRAQELAAEREAPRVDGAGSLAGTRPPILPASPSFVPLGHLSYSALDAYERCAYRFYVERVLGIRLGSVGVAAAGAEPGEAEPEPRTADELHDPAHDPADDAADPGVAGALGLGNAVHAALEWSARAGWAAPDDARLRSLLSREGLAGDEALDRARALVEGWLGSEIRGSLEGLRLRPEAPFALPLGGTILRGNIDLLASGERGIWVVDYKSDRVTGHGTADAGRRYASQRAVYALAAAGALGEGQPIHAVHVFLERPGEPVVETFDGAALERSRARLGELVARIRGGSFEVTDEPFAALCFGCPAAERLCPRPAWRPRRRAA